MAQVTLPATAGNHATPSAVDPIARAIAIPELLEGILVYVDYETLFACKKVNKTFSAILTSKKMRALMLLDLPCSVNTFRCPLYDAKAIAKIFHPFAFAIDPTPLIGPVTCHGTGVVNVAQSFWFDLAENINISNETRRERMRLYGERTSLMDNEDLDTTPCTKPGFWRSVTIPGLRTVVCQCHWDWHAHEMSSTKDISLGEAMEFCVESTKKCWAGECDTWNQSRARIAQWEKENPDYDVI